MSSHASRKGEGGGSTRTLCESPEIRFKVPSGVCFVVEEEGNAFIGYTFVRPPRTYAMHSMNVKITFFFLFTRKRHRTSFNVKYRSIICKMYLKCQRKRFLRGFIFPSWRYKEE